MLEKKSFLYLTKFSQHQAQHYWPILSEQEQALAQKKATQQLQDHCILSYGFRRKLLAKLLKKVPQQLEFTTIENNKPILVEQTLHFNVSHSDDYWVMLVDQTDAVGVDVEGMQRKIDFLNLAKRFFAPREAEIIANADNPSVIFWQFWTAKEALLKLSGKGIVNGLEKVELVFNAEQQLIPTAEPLKKWQLKLMQSWPDVLIAAVFPRIHTLAMINF